MRDLGGGGIEMVDPLKRVAPIVGILAAGVCVLGLALGGPGVLRGSTEEGGTAIAESQAALSGAAVSATDPAAPVKTETATFALG
jgi:hypothetical protein